MAGKHCSHLLLNCLKQLAELRDSYKFSYNNELENAVGAAIKSMGPDVVLNIISLKVCGYLYQTYPTCFYYLIIGNII